MADIQYDDIAHEFTAYNQVNDLDLMTMQQQSSGILFKIKKSILALVVLGGRSIVGAGHILTSDGQSTLTNKRYDSPKFNSTATTAFTSADADKVSGLTTTKTDLDRTAGSTANFQTQITGNALDIQNIIHDVTIIQNNEIDINNDIDDLDQRVTDVETVTGNLADIRLFTLEFTAGSTSETITEASIKYALDNTSKKVSISSQILVYDLDGTKMTAQTGFQVVRQVTGGVTHLDHIVLTTTVGHTYFLTIDVRLI